ncbi:MAG: Mrp/NBP35 family ATP-binding protein [Planctomycetota bacterium]|nr:Mrp/NBP35 family ATP-binding protein [Planctomycetota bacterium]MDA0932073.1 Mrp/NBP35 family ATP-binding protein [Planctomycetota bacterium]
MTNPSARDAVLQALGTVRDPDRGTDIVRSNAVRELRVEDGKVRFLLALPKTSTPEAAACRAEAERAAMGVASIASVEVKLVNAPPEQAGMPGKRPIPGARHVIAVSSGKGGVGKSTVCVNLACAVQALGYRTGVLDGDIYGPNVPLMLGVRGRPEGSSERLFPFVSHGIQVMSMGMLVPEDQPMIWRGPMLNKAVQQFMFQVDWHDLDFLFVDMPPGTGDVQLTLTQNTDITGAVVVTTPQEVAVQDVRKAIRMFEKIEVPILGIVENMAWFQPPGSNERYEIFGSGGGARIEAEFGTPLIGQIPIGIPVREGGDSGMPITLSDPSGPIATAFLETARAMLARIPTAAATR